MIFFELFWTFFKIGLFTFGGGYAMIPLIQDEVVKNGWLQPDMIIDFIAISESTPGTFAINISTYVGTHLAGIFGAFCATLGVVLPSTIIILMIAKIYNSFSENKYVRGCLSGLRPAVVGLIASAVLSIAKTVFFKNSISFQSIMNRQFVYTVAIFAIVVTMAFKKVNLIKVIGVSAILGLLTGYIDKLIF